MGKGKALTPRQHLAIFGIDQAVEKMKHGLGGN
jgi:hypothetical protein